MNRLIILVKFNQTARSLELRNSEISFCCVYLSGTYFNSSVLQLE